MEQSVISINPQRDLAEFFDFIYGNQSGFAYSPTKSADELATWAQAFFEWPAQKKELISHIIENTATKEVYYGPALYSQPSAKKEFVKCSLVLWTEFDGNAPSNWQDIPQPSLRIRSSEDNHEHVYWKLEHSETEVDKIEALNRAICYQLEADSSAWDATQILRPITTHNHKRNKPVFTLVQNRSTYTRESFSTISQPIQYVEQDIALVDIPDPLPVIAKYKWDESAFEFFLKKDIPVGERSSALMRLGYFCAEMKMSDAESLAVLRNADERWKKFTTRTDRIHRLLEIINRARQKYPLVAPEEILIDEYPIYNFNEFIELNLIIEWVIPGILQRAGVVVLSGPPATGKTQLTLQFFIHMAIGKPFIGWAISTPTPVAFFSMEMGAADLKYFLDQMSNGITEEEKILLKQNFFIIPLGYGVMLASSSEQAKIIRFMRKNPQIKGIGFDSLGMSTLDELSSEAPVKAIFDFVNKLKTEFDIFIWFVHHNRKAQSSNRKPNKLSDVYGSQYITSNATTIIGVWPITAGGQKIELTGLKVRLAKAFAPFVITRIDHLNFEVTSEKPLPVGGEVINDSFRANFDI